MGPLLMCWRALPIVCRWHDLVLARQYVEITHEQLLENPLRTMQRLYAALQWGEFDWTSPTVLRYLLAIKAHAPYQQALSESTRRQLASQSS